jgi:hypothetical protein
MLSLPQMTLEIARGYLGIKEATGQNDGPFIEKLQLWASGAAAKLIAPWLERAPWCALFATYCVHEAAARIFADPLIPRECSSARLYAWYKKKGLLLASPVAGCIGLVKGGPRGTHSHTFIVESVDEKFVYGIDGNWKNAVSRSKRLKEACDYGKIV